MNIKEEFDKFLKMHSGGPVNSPKPNTPPSNDCISYKEKLLFQQYKDIIEHLYQMKHKPN